MAPLDFLTKYIISPRELIFLIGSFLVMAGFIFIIPLIIRKEVWRLVAGIASSVVGLVCYALSSSFNNLFGGWKWWKIMLYIIFSFFVLFLVSSAKAWRNLSFLHHNKVQVMYLFMGSTTIYSFLSDRSQKGKPDPYNLVSYAAFAIMSFSCGFTELVYFFSGLVISQLMKIELLLGFVGLCFSYFLIIYPKTGMLIEPSYHVVIKSTKQRALKLVILASAQIPLIYLAHSFYFKYNFLSGELMSSTFKIAFWIVFFLHGYWYSYLVWFRVTGQHFIVPHSNFLTGYLLICFASTSSYRTFFPDRIPAIKKQDAYILAVFPAIYMRMLGLPKLQRLYKLLFFYFCLAFTVTIFMFVNMWLCFVGIGLSFLPFILRSYLDATPQSNTEDLYQVTAEVASNNNDQAVAVIEVELASSLQSNSEGESSQVVCIMEASTQQFSEDESQVDVVVSEVVSPQGSNEDVSEVVTESDIASTESESESGDVLA